MNAPCPFCAIQPDEVVLSNELVYAVFDRFPVSRGHMLVIAKRHVADYFELTAEELVATHQLLRRCRDLLAERFSPAGYNLGANVGRPAGQTIFHLHLHLIPRYHGDHPSPRGGIRHVIQGKGDY